MTLSSVTPRYATFTQPQPGARRPGAPTTADMPAGGGQAQAYPAYPAYPQQPAYPAYPSYPAYPAPERGGFGHGLGLIGRGLGEVAVSAAHGLWSVAKFAGTAAFAVVGFVASAVVAVLGGAWKVLSTVGHALGRGGRAIFDPGYDEYRRHQQPYPYNRPYQPQPDYPSYQAGPNTNWGLDLNR